MPEAWSGSIAHTSPFHRSLPAVSAHCHIAAMHATHSSTDDECTAHVGTESALAGSACSAMGAAASASAGSAPTPSKKGACAPRPSGPRPNAHVPPSVAKSASAQAVTAPFGRTSPAFAARRPARMMRLVAVRSSSAPPCSQSASASDSAYALFAMMPVGIVASTNSSRNWKPKSTRGGVPLRESARKSRNARYGSNDAWKKMPARFCP
mmetsp:Transcript_13004/g.40832  ORF Transcript_13004/g.40832 Transcript_13004/m.40832 type:complete len:209 (-) Transcript_13004:81-707(-)